MKKAYSSYSKFFKILHDTPPDTPGQPYILINSTTTRNTDPLPLGIDRPMSYQYRAHASRDIAPSNEQTTHSHRLRGGHVDRSLSHDLPPCQTAQACFNLFKCLKWAFLLSVAFTSVDCCRFETCYMFRKSLKFL